MKIKDLREKILNIPDNMDIEVYLPVKRADQERYLSCDFSIVIIDNSKYIEPYARIIIE